MYIRTRADKSFHRRCYVIKEKGFLHILRISSEKERKTSNVSKACILFAYRHAYAHRHPYSKLWMCVCVCMCFRLFLLFCFLHYHFLCSLLFTYVFCRVRCVFTYQVGLIDIKVSEIITMVLLTLSYAEVSIYTFLCVVYRQPDIRLKTFLTMGPIQYCI